MRFLIGFLLVDRQIRQLFREEGGRYRFFPAGALLPGLMVDQRQRRRIEHRMPPVYAWLIGTVPVANLIAVGGIVLWDRFVGYVGPLAALAVFAAILASLAGMLHLCLYLALRRVVRKTPEDP